MFITWCLFSSLTLPLSLIWENKVTQSEESKILICWFQILLFVCIFPFFTSHCISLLWNFVTLKVYKLSFIHENIKDRRRAILTEKFFFLSTSLSLWSGTFPSISRTLLWMELQWSAGAATPGTSWLSDWTRAGGCPLSSASLCDLPPLNSCKLLRVGAWPSWPSVRPRLTRGTVRPPPQPAQYRPSAAQVTGAPDLRHRAFHLRTSGRNLRQHL